MSFEFNAVLLAYGEVSLKGKNQHFFLRRLRQNLEKKLRCLEIEWPVQQPYGYGYLEIPAADEASLEQVLDTLAEVPGLVWYAPAHCIFATEVGLSDGSLNYDLIEKRVLELARDCYRPETTFAVRAHRAPKHIPLTSPELEKRLGTAIIEKTAWNAVQLKEPDQTFYVNIQAEGVFVHDAKYPGMGGLPVGASGQVLSLLSGGIDSPVAAALVAKRGCLVDFIHFTVASIQPEQAASYKISRIVQQLSHITLHSRLFLVPYTHFELAVLGKKVPYELNLFRRFMVRVAESLARQIKAQALVTGDNLGQVASQTLQNLVSNSQATALPILRPLLTYDKQEIVDLAQEIGTYATSLEPYKDCCSLLVSHPQTKSRHRILSRKEEIFLPNYDTLIQQTLDDAICLQYVCGELTGSCEGNNSLQNPHPLRQAQDAASIRFSHRSNYSRW